MVAARRADSQTKRAAVLAAIDELACEAAPITVASVARRAKVSTWLVYTSELRAAVAAAQARRADEPARAPTPAGVATDLALARAEITRLRAERDRQSHQLRLALGARVDQLNKADLAERVDELTRHNRQLSSELTQVQGDARRLQACVAELEDDLTAARTSLRRMIRSGNLPAPVTTTNTVTTTRGGSR